MAEKTNKQTDEIQTKTEQAYIERIAELEKELAGCRAALAAAEKKTAKKSDGEAVDVAKQVEAIYNGLIRANIISRKRAELFQAGKK